AEATPFQLIQRSSCPVASHSASLISRPRARSHSCACNRVISGIGDSGKTNSMRSMRESTDMCSAILRTAQCCGGRSFDRKVFVDAQPDSACKRNETQRPPCGVGDVEKMVYRLVVQAAVVLLSAAMEAVVGVTRAVPIGCDDLPESGPGCQLPGQGVVHCQNVGYGELRERLAGDRAAFAMDADDFDLLPTLAARYGRSGHAGLVGEDRELRGPGVRAEPAGEPGPIGTRIEIPALEAL